MLTLHKSFSAVVLACVYFRSILEQNQHTFRIRKRCELLDIFVIVCDRIVFVLHRSFEGKFEFRDHLKQFSDVFASLHTSRYITEVELKTNFDEPTTRIHRLLTRNKGQSLLQLARKSQCLRFESDEIWNLGSDHHDCFQLVQHAFGERCCVEIVAAITSPQCHLNPLKLIPDRFHRTLQQVNILQHILRFVL